MDNHFILELETTPSGRSLSSSGLWWTCRSGCAGTAGTTTTCTARPSSNKMLLVSNANNGKPQKKVFFSFLVFIPLPGPPLSSLVVSWRLPIWIFQESGGGIWVMVKVGYQQFDTLWILAGRGGGAGGSSVNEVWQEIVLLSLGRDKCKMLIAGFIQKDRQALVYCTWALLLKTGTRKLRSCEEYFWDFYQRLPP